MLQLRSIHYLRAVAAMMVVVFHIFGNVTFMHPQVGSVYWLRGGVDIFFVISGYVMVTSTQNRKIAPMQFIAQRAKRIIPIYWVATLLCIIIMQIKGPWDFKLKSFLFIPAMNPQINKMQPVLEQGWTLNYEMFFYAIFAISLFAQKKFHFPIVAVTLIAIVLFGRHIDGSEIFEFYASPIILEFLMGMIIAHYSFRLPTLCLPVGFALMYFLEPLSLNRVFELGIPAMLIVAGGVSAEGYFKPSKILNFLGSASYSIYLFHVLALGVSIYMYERIEMSNSAFVAISFVVCMSVGCAFYYILERPIIAYFATLKVPQIKEARSQPS